MKKWVIFGLMILSNSAFAQGPATVSGGLSAQIVSYRTLLTLEKKMLNSPKQRDFLVRLLDSAGNISASAKREKITSSQIQQMLGVEPQREVIRISSQLIKQYPKDPMLAQFYWLRGRVYGEMNDPAASGQDFKNAYTTGVVGSEFWTKSGVAYSDFLKANQRANDALVVLKTVLKGSKPAFKGFILESLAQLQSQLRMYADARVTYDQLLKMDPKQLTFSRDSIVASKGFILGKLKIQAYAVVTETQGLSPLEKLSLYRNWMLETLADGREAEVSLLLKDPAVAQEKESLGFILAAEAIKVIFDRQNQDQFRAIVDQTNSIGKEPLNEDFKRAWLKSIEQLKAVTSRYQKQVAKTAAKNPLEAKTLNKLYSLVTIAENDPKALQEVKYNQAGLALIAQDYAKADQLYSELKDYRDSAEKSQYAFLGGLSKKHSLKQEWSFSPNVELNEVEKARLEQYQNKNCTSEKGVAQSAEAWSHCVEALKIRSQVSGDGIAQMTAMMEELAFKESAPLAVRESVFSALFDYLMKSGNVTAAMELSQKASASGVEFQSDLKNQAAQTAKNTVIKDLFKLYEQNLNDQAIKKVDELREKKVIQNLPEALIIAALASQRKNDSKAADQYYSEFENYLANAGEKGFKYTEAKFEDLYHTGRAIGFDENKNFEESTKHWAKIKVWASPIQKEAALKAAWYSGQFMVLPQLVKGNFFCKDVESAKVCSQAWNRFILTWPVLSEKIGQKPAWIQPQGQLQDQLVQMAVQSRFKPETVSLAALSAKLKEVQSSTLVDWVAYFPAWFKASDNILNQYVAKTRQQVLTEKRDVETLLKSMQGFTQTLKQVESFQVASWPQLKVSALIATAALCSYKEQEIEEVLKTDFFKQAGVEKAKSTVEQLATQLKEKRIKNLMQATEISQQVAWIPDSWKPLEPSFTQGLSQEQQTQWNLIWKTTTHWDSKCVSKDSKVVRSITEIEQAAQKALWPRVGYWADQLAALNLGPACEFKEQLLSRMMRPSSAAKALAAQKQVTERQPASAEQEQVQKDKTP